MFSTITRLARLSSTRLFNGRMNVLNSRCLCRSYVVGADQKEDGSTHKKYAFLLTHVELAKEMGQPRETDDEKFTPIMGLAVAAMLALLGTCGYLIVDELFSQGSPHAVFTKSLNIIQDDNRCMDLFGSSITGSSGGGPKSHEVAHHKYQKDGVQRIQVSFNIMGERNEGTARAEMEMIDLGVWNWRYLYVETKSQPRSIHVLIDNRMKENPY